ncbi:MAG: insulinase family protein [Planctomycetes bacterium]|nr:insulinase family protein [Planctomycetota bacterium]
MNLRKTWTGLAILILVSPASAQRVAHEKYVLPNGMTVILHEDHTLPTACVNLWYRVGSKDEPPGRSGFAHLFEHLMFMGTRRVPEGDFDRLMEAEGGYNNASTSEDRTNYFSIGPAELLPTLLWLDADRLEDLGREMNEEKLNKQRDVVRNERRQSYENAPYGKSELRVYELMFPPGHPYHIPVIGTHEDLEAARVEDVKNFFATYYVPSNASLVVAGDFSPASVKPLIESLFGSLPRGSDVVHARAESVRLSGVTRHTMTDTVQFARTSLVYHSPPGYAPGDAELDLAAAVLTSGISSRLYQKLIYQNELAVDVSAYQSSMLLGSLFYIQATAKPGVRLEALESAIDEAVAEFIDKGATADELERQKARLEYGMVARMQSLLAKADRLNQYEFAFGEPDSFERDLNRYRRATPADVQQWAKKVLTPDARLVLRVIPEQPSPEANPREAQPSPATAGRFTPPLPETFTLSNGVAVHHWRKTELPLVALRLLLHRGAAQDGPDRAGLASITAEMLDEGAGERGAVEFSDALDILGADLGAGCGYDNTIVSLSVLKRNAEAALALFADAVLRPRFDPKEWERVQKLRVEELKQALDEPRIVADRVAMRAFFGDKHPYSRPTVGTPVSAAALRLDDVKTFHRQNFRPANAVFLSAGDLTAAELRALLEKQFAAWTDPKDLEAVGQPVFPSAENRALRVAVVDRPDAVQTVIRFMMPGATYGDPRRIKLQLFNTILGDGFTSRLNQNLREEHGYTYGARSWYQLDPAVGYFGASSSVRADVTGAAVGEFLKEFAAIRGGDITADETQKSRTTRRREMIEDFEGLGGTLSLATTLVRNGRPFTELGEELAAVAKVTEAELNAIARDAVPLQAGLLLLVGDRRLIAEQLKGLDLPLPAELTVTGDPRKD